MQIKKSDTQLSFLIVLGNVWQCRIYIKLINSFAKEVNQITIVGLREEVIAKPIWKDLKVDRINFIDLTHEFELDRLSLLSSLTDYFKILNILRDYKTKILGSNDQNKVVFLTDDLYRVHELSALTVFNPNQIICLSHGLRSEVSSWLNSIKKLLSINIRLFIFCNLSRILRFQKIISIKRRTTFLSVFKNIKKGSYHSGNLAVQSSVDDISEVHKSVEDKNILFMGSGAFRYNEVEHKKHCLAAIDFITRYCEEFDLNLFFKFKPDENINFLLDKYSKKPFTFLNQNSDLFYALAQSSPAKVFCSNGSTVFSELCLAGIDTYIYKTSFKGYDDFYYEIYKGAGAKILDYDQNLPEKPLEAVDLNYLKLHIGYKENSFGILNDLIK